jgi:transketolase
MAKQQSERDIKNLVEQARVIRKHVIEMVYNAGSGHPGGSLSAADIMVALYFEVLNHRPEEPTWPDRDRFVLSKGHAAPALYACLAETGYLPVEELKTLRQIGSRLQGHPDMRKTPGVESSTGSEGQGLSNGIGMALAGKLDKKNYTVYVMIGDGENDCGQIWEAAMSAAFFKLDNLVCIIDRNKLQLDGATKDIMS